MRRQPREPRRDELERFLPTDEANPASPTRWLWLLGFWTALPLLMSVSGELIEGRKPTFPGFLDLFYGGLYWWAWAALTPVVAALGRRFPLGGLATLLHVAIHFAASWLLAITLNLFMALATFLLPVEYDAVMVLRQTFHVGQGLGALSQIFYWLVLATATAFAIYQKSRQRDALLAEARLQVLKAQVRPHFLFNTLHTVSTLMDEDVTAARRMITHLSDLLRASFRGQTLRETTLGDEIDLAKLYLDIEKVRFADRLRPHFEIAENTRQALVPHLLLQPLIENAIQHGISRDSTAGELVVRAELSNKTLLLRIEDDGPGPTREDRRPEAAKGDGIGLANTRARLRELYGEHGRLTLRPATPRGTVVEVEIPFHHQPIEAPR